MTDSFRNSGAGGAGGERQRLPSLNALRAFEASARHLSMTLAAAELGVTQGAVSRQVTLLQEVLGIRLFTRSGRQIALTAAGEDYFAIMQKGFETLSQGHARFMRRQESNSLRIRLPPTFAIRWFMSRLHRLHAEHPSLEVQITTSHQPADFSKGDVDLAIWSTPEPRGNFRKIRLFGEYLAPVCSPNLPKSRALARPSDLGNHMLLVSMQRPEDWSMWFAAAGLTETMRDVMRFENSNLAYQAALEGAGVALAQLRLVRDDLRTGRLVIPFPVPIPIRPARAYYLIVPKGESRTSSVRRFRRWLWSEIVRENASADFAALMPTDTRIEPADAQRTRVAGAADAI